MSEFGVAAWCLMSPRRACAHRIHVLHDDLLGNLGSVLFFVRVKNINTRCANSTINNTGTHMTSINVEVLFELLEVIQNVSKQDATLLLPQCGPGHQVACGKQRGQGDVAYP